jgi:hypothetical protein
MSALEGAARQASGAPSARLRAKTYHAISDIELRYVGTDRGYDPDDFVTQDRRRRHEIGSGERQVSVTQSGCLHIDGDFAPNRRGDVHVLEVEAATECVKYKCFQWVASVDAGSSPAAGYDVGGVDWRHGP